jgi:fructokinase
MPTPSHPPAAAPLVVGLGEVLFDVLDDEARFGGAPANFACHAAALGARAHLVSAVGDDDLGRRAEATLRAHGVDTQLVATVAGAATGRTAVRLDARGVPNYRIERDVAWDEIPWTPAAAHLARRADAVCFGTVAQRAAASRATIERFLGVTRPACLRVLDVNLRWDHVDRGIIERSLHLCSVLKANEEELAAIADVLSLEGGDDEARLRDLVTRYGLRLAILTLGERGALLRDPTHTVSVAAEAVDVVDTLGAGDAFAATATLGLLAGTDLRVVAGQAARVAARVCTQRGAVPTPVPDVVATRPAGSGA